MDDTRSFAAIHVIIIFLLAFTFPLHDAKIIDEDFKTLSSWSVLDRFCFLPASNAASGPGQGESGLFSYNATFKAGTKQSIALYYDGFLSWSEIYGKPASEMSCNERLGKERIATTSFTNRSTNISPSLTLLTPHSSHSSLNHSLAASRKSVPHHQTLEKRSLQ